MTRLTLKPFIKWAGGKSQLLPTLCTRYPFAFKRYVEPFVGGGAVLWDILSRYRLKEVYISDLNGPLINTYLVIQQELPALIRILSALKRQYFTLPEHLRKDYYYLKQREYNAEIQKNNKLDAYQAALFIFLNKTCFNGLYRVNKQGMFNIPFGHGHNQVIFDRNNLELLSQALKNVVIHHADYKNTLAFIDRDTFVYLDPPYRPLSKKAYHNQYNREPFTDAEQIQLAGFTRQLHRVGAKFLLSNSNPKEADPNDNFFDLLYQGFHLERVFARRAIGGCRKVTDILVHNFKAPEIVPKLRLEAPLA